MENCVLWWFGVCAVGKKNCNNKKNKKKNKDIIVNENKYKILK